MTYLRRVPGLRRTFPFGETGLLLAAEALEMEDPELCEYNAIDVCDEITLDRPPHDWENSAILLLARVQLDQLVAVVRQFTGIDDPLDDLAKTNAEIESGATTLWVADTDRYEAEGGELPQDYDTLVYSVEEALALRRALPLDPLISHSFTFDGSITFTHGPVYPACPTLGLKGCEIGEFDDEPLAIFDAARRATGCAATLAFQVKNSRSEAPTNQ